MERQWQPLLRSIAVSGVGLMMVSGLAWSASPPSAGGQAIVLAQNTTSDTNGGGDSAEFKAAIEELRQGLHEQRMALEDMKRAIERQIEGTELVEKGLMHELELRQSGWMSK